MAATWAIFFQLLKCRRTAKEKSIAHSAAVLHDGREEAEEGEGREEVEEEEGYVSGLHLGVSVGGLCPTR